MNKIEIRGVIVPSNYDLEWMQEYIEKGVLTPESYIRKQIDMADKNKPLEMYINSPGGSVFAAYEIINAITQWKMENKQAVNITVGAMAASAASAISVLSSANIKMFRNSKLMFHGAWSETVGGAEAHKDTADLLQKINADIKAALIGKYGIPVDVVDSWFAEGRQGWMSADEAIKYKMADEIIDGDDMEIEFGDTDVASIEANGLAIAAMVKKDDVQNVQNVAVVADALQDIAEEKKDDSGKSLDEAEAGNSPEEIVTKSDDEIKPDEPSKSDGMPETGSNGSDSAQPSVNELVENKLNERLADHKQQIDKLMLTLSKTEKSRATTQGKLDAEMAARAKDKKHFEERLAATQEALKQANARLTKLTLGSLTFSPVIETWPEALSACGGDYAKARKQYPDAYAQFMSNNNKR